MKCALFEEASLINCTQRFIVSHPEHWVLAWLVISNVFSLYFMIIVWFEYKHLGCSFYCTLKMLLKKASFWTMIFFFLFTTIYDILRFDTTDGMSVAMSLMLLLGVPPLSWLSFGSITFPPFSGQVEMNQTSGTNMRCGFSCCIGFPLLCTV